MNNSNYQIFDLGNLLDVLTGNRTYTEPRTRRGMPAPVPPARKTLEQEIAERKERIAQEQKALEDAEKQLAAEQKKIKYVADDEKIEMLIPREKVLKMIQSLTEVLKKEPNAEKYHLTIKL